MLNKVIWKMYKAFISWSSGCAWVNLSLKFIIRAACFWWRFSLSMTMLSIFKKDSGSLKFFFFFFFFFEAGWNREYFVSVQFSNNVFALNQRDTFSSLQFISEKSSSTFMPERNKSVSSANMTGFSFSEHL